MASHPADTRLNPYPRIIRCSGIGCTLRVASVINPKAPSLPMKSWVQLGPTPPPMSRPVSSTSPVPVTTSMDTAMSSILPYSDEHCPADRVARYPPSVEHISDDGKCPRVNPSALSRSSRCQPMIPPWARTRLFCGSIRRTRSISLRSTMTLPTPAMVPPHTPDPAPKGTSTSRLTSLFARAHSTISTSSAVDLGHTTQSGGSGAYLPASFSICPAGQRSRA
jgi:hypothetical protein